MKLGETDLAHRTHRRAMATNDKCCTIVPYFKVPDGNMQAFRKLCEAFVEKSSTEPGCLYYGFSFDGSQVHCREGYADAAGALAHLENVGALLQQALKLAEVLRLEVHGPAEELAKLRGPLAALKPQFFTLEYGFRR
jgi:quinol monooxygenase YgiN